MPFEAAKPPQWAQPILQGHGALWRYGIAVAAVLAATGVRLAFTPFLGVHTPYSPFVFAVMVAALFGGRGPGLTADALSALVVGWLFLGPLHHLFVADPAAIWGLVLFVVAATPVALLVGSLRESLLARARAEEALERQAQLVDLSHDAVITMDSERRILTWNQGAAEMYGWPERDAVGKVAHQLLQTICRTPFTEIDEIPARKRQWEGELIQTARDGRQLVVDSREVLLDGGTATPAYILTISRDITERRRMEEDLRASENQFRTLANAIPQLCGMAHADGGFFWANQRWCDYTGLLPEQSMEWGWLSAIDLDASRTALDQWRHAIAAGDPFESVFSVRGTDGFVRPFLARAVPMRDRDGMVVSWFATMTDISEQRKTEDALRKSHAEELARSGEFQAIMEAMPVAMFFSRDSECRYVFGNRSAYELFRLPPGSNLSKSAPPGEEPTGFRVLKNGVEVPPYDLPLQKAAATGQAVYDIELELAFSDQRRGYIIGNAVPFLDAEGQPRGAVGIFVDITGRKQNEERLRHAKKLESIGILAGGIAHDFNNLLTVIIGNADSALKKYPSSAELPQIITASLRAADLTRHLLAYAGKGGFNIKTFDLTDLISRSKRLLSASIPQNVDLVFHLTDQQLLIKADPTQIEQVLINLVSNGGEAIPPETEGRIDVATSTCEITQEIAGKHAPAFDARPGMFVCLEVTDNGSGMDEATLPQIFDPFFSTRFTGRGLGLAAVDGIVRSCNGFIDVQSSPGAGTRFRVFLPAAATQVAAKASAGSSSEGSRRRDREPSTILVVDDEELVRQFAGAALASGGFKVLEAKDGRDALEVLASAVQLPSLVLLDLTTPAIDALELVRILDHDYPGTQIIITSDYLTRETRRQFPAGSVSGFLQKPYTQAALMQKVEEALQRRTRREDRTYGRTSHGRPPGSEH